MQKDLSGGVPRADVIMVLRGVLGATQISLKIDGHIITMVKDGIPEVQVLPEIVGRRLLHRLNAKYGVNIEFFYHPEMCLEGGQTTQ